MSRITVKENVEQSEAPKKPKFETVTDSLGRTIQLRQLDPMQQARLVMGVGGDVSQNSTYMNGFAMPAAMVAHIDDDFFGFPSSIKQIEAMLGMLGAEGMEAISSHLLAKYEAAKAESDKAALSAEQAAAKN
ncbi:hypothetical protein QN366_04825 [Pseudomonas sp. CCC3.2]|uniref:hypothetical protein n=1 Tax=unclassified Pseudomonas TaxID=196821 RepID=UPI002AB5AD76|nr:MULTISPECIES: hypothetical protein [unclassified Pseudomonas]MDY7559963.1 hypothetical protein [Pseudomonas sp. AB6]MEA9994537.1 hypothetical protein [Pseudomonas sp. AA4]MEB0085682.1 hypothetical protein [Pseudomonas sp. RTI1]MEB0125993.1 hypothetical protein [Pseudomonas sp. CCC1.2]MEB0152797.1 hypothetical protein [Pseudomonas sp. CCC4.3]